MNLTAKIYHDEDAARRHFEAIRWPNGPECPHCGVVGEATELKGKSTRPGVYKCKACRKPLSGRKSLSPSGYWRPTFSRLQRRA